MFCIRAEELDAVRAAAMAAGASAAVVTRHHALGGAGAVDLAQAVVAACSGSSEFKYLYDAELPIKVRCNENDYLSLNL
jgi:formyltetrahydrofolate synthetase